MTADPLTCVATIPAQTTSPIFHFLHSQNVEKLFVCKEVLLLRLVIILVFDCIGAAHIWVSPTKDWLLTFCFK